MAKATRAITRVLLCDDHPISLLGTKCALSDIFPEKNITFFEAHFGKKAIEIAQKNELDLVILDLRLPDISGLEVLKELKGFETKASIMVLTSEENPHVLIQLLRYNVDAILLKTYTLEMLKSAFLHLEKNQNEQTYLDPSLEDKIKIEANKELLSPREFEVLELLLKGHTNKAIAALLKCSPETVKAHCTRIREKTNLRNRDEIAAWFHGRS